MVAKKLTISDAELKRQLRAIKPFRKDRVWWLASKFTEPMGPYSKRAEAVEAISGIRRMLIRHPEIAHPDYGAEYRPARPAIRKLILPKRKHAVSTGSDSVGLQTSGGNRRRLTRR